MMKAIMAKMTICILFMLTSTNLYAAFADYPVPVEFNITGSFDIIGIGAAPIDFYPANGDFSFSYLAEPGIAYDSSVYITPGIYQFTSTADSVFPDPVKLSMTVNEGQIGLRTFINWNNNIFDVLTVWDVNTSASSIWLTATDIDNDGVRGFAMVNGPFAGYNVTIDAAIVTPIPAAAWLMGSGLLALAGLARRKA